MGDLFSAVDRGTGFGNPSAVLAVAIIVVRRGHRPAGRSKTRRTGSRASTPSQALAKEWLQAADIRTGAGLTLSRPAYVEEAIPEPTGDVSTAEDFVYLVFRPTA